MSLLVLLAIQFEFGMAVNLSNLPSISPFVLSFSNVLSALNQAGTVAVVHAALGTALTIISLIDLVMALISKIRGVQIFGILGFLSMALAETSGVLFVLSGFQNNNYSHGMATNFILTFGFYFLELYFLKPAAKTQAR
ncbi:MAG: hypothetical protein ABSE06_05700 [Anaerolineaceae bacterium]|jgi:hypothetical protein